MTQFQLALDILMVGALIIGFLFFVVWLETKLDIKILPNTPPSTMTSTLPVWTAEEAWNLYPRCANALVKSVLYSYSRIGLARPAEPFLHMAEYGKGVTYDKNRGWVFHFYFDRAIDVSNGGVMKNIHMGITPLSTVPVGDMIRTINEILGNCCSAFGLDPMRIDKGYDVGSGRVHFEVVRSERKW